MCELKECNFDVYANLDSILNRHIIVQLETFTCEWQNRILLQSNGSKLRTSKLYKTNYYSESYLTQNSSEN